MPSTGALLLMLATFVLTFVVARVLRRWFLRKSPRRPGAEARQGESRQVRRARERRGRVE